MRIETDDGLVIRPRPLHGGTFESYDDHRMATAGAVLGLVAAFANFMFNRADKAFAGAVQRVDASLQYALASDATEGTVSTASQSEGRVEKFQTASILR